MFTVGFYGMVLHHDFSIDFACNSLLYVFIVCFLCNDFIQVFSYVLLKLFNSHIQSTTESRMVSKGKTAGNLESARS